MIEIKEATCRLAGCRAALERSETRFRAVIERNADAIVVVGHDGLIHFANPMAAFLFGIPGNELIGTPFGFPVVEGETTELDLVANGTARVVEMRVVHSEWEGRPACLASLRDITERKLAEDRARDLIREQSGRVAAETAARRFRLLADCSSILAYSLEEPSAFAGLAELCVRHFADWVLVYSLDDQRKIETMEIAHCDPARAVQTRQLRDRLNDGRRSQPFLDWLAHPEPALAQNLFDDRLRPRVPRDPRISELIRTLGARSFIRVPVKCSNRIVGAIALARGDREFEQQDLALSEEIAVRVALAMDNARLFSEAQQANRTKSDFLAVISHDLRTPLASIIGYTDLMNMGIPDPLDGVNGERVERIRTAARHGLYLLDELLFFARLDAHREQPDVQHVNPRVLMLEVRALMEPLAHERGLQFSIDLSADSPHLHTDPDKLRQALVNLVANAVKYTDHGHITLSGYSQDDQFVFQVRDTGIGIDEQYLEKIFEPFWQVDKSRRTGDGGTGLGLSVVRRLVQLLDGVVCVQSAVGQGSTFTVKLPIRGPQSRPSTD